MFPRWRRLGIRPQLTLIVVLGTILTTLATLFIADNAINGYVIQQASTQEKQNLKVARQVLENQYGEHISISTSIATGTINCPFGCMVIDLPGTGRTATLSSANNFGRFVVNGDTDFVDRVQQLTSGSVSVYQCNDVTGQGGHFNNCPRIATTVRPPGATQTGALQRAVDGGKNVFDLTTVQAAQGGSVYQLMNAENHADVREWIGTVTMDGTQSYVDFAPMFDPQQRFIGVLAVGVPLDTITTLVSRTRLELILIGAIIMIAGVILALFFANTIIGTLQRAARQVNSASERIGTIATQQASGSQQQVWAINAINQALQNFSDTAKDISHRTDQLALMGNQVLQRRAEISPNQIDSILAFITRSVRDISGATKQQASQYERMTGAMQAVIEIAEQVAGNSQQSSESAERLELVVRQLQQIVGVRLGQRRGADSAFGMESASSLSSLGAGGVMSESQMAGTVRAVRPATTPAAAPMRGPSTGARRMNLGGATGMGGMMGPMGQMPQMGQMSQMPQPQMAPASQGTRMPPQGFPVAGMVIAGGNNGNGTAGNMSAMGAMGAMGMPNGNGGNMGMAGMGGMAGAGPRVNGFGTGMGQPPAGAPPMDWRLPPLPEMPPMPDWMAGGQSNGGNGQAMSYGGRMQGMSGGNSMPNYGGSSMPGMAGPGGWGGNE